MLWSRDRSGNLQAVVSRESALVVYELSAALPGRAHLTVPKGFRKRQPEGVILHFTDLPEGVIRRQGGYRITTPLQTLLDVAASSLSPEQFDSAVKDALESGLVRSQTLADAVVEAQPPVLERFSHIGFV